MTILMTTILRHTLAALVLASTAWWAIPAAADEVETCAKASGERATAICTRAIESGRYDDRGLAELYGYRCLAWIERKDADKAIEDCGQAIRLSPDDAPAFSARAIAYELKGQYGRAIEDIGQIIRLNPNSASAFNNRGVAYQHTGQYDRSIQDLDQAIRIDPASAMAFSNRGNAYQLKGQYDRAIADYDQAIRIDPNYTTAFYDRAEAYLQHALADFKKYSELAPSDSDGPKAIERVTNALNPR